ncbi:MAG TPA: polyphosphate kinase 1 [Fibrobacteria bacterium]|nr:polyphosphate kinase 1 [Fibrobacteria bacterium]HOX52415.1 polyphosphate kinase 1 [Fibrobacteria bacterium]
MPKNAKSPHGLPFPKELSWLLFNERVLEEANDPRHPLLDRLRFLGIYSNNLDEFYRVRVASLRRMESENGPGHRVGGTSVRKLLQTIAHRVTELGERFEESYERISRELLREKIRIVDETRLSKEQEAEVRAFFTERVRPRLVPILVPRGAELPLLHDHVVHLAISFTGARSGAPPLALIEVPETLPRFLELSMSEGFHCVILLEDVVRWGLREVFWMFQPRQIHAWAFKVNRDAELDLNQEFAEGFLTRVNQGLRKRAAGAPVRVVHDREMPESILKSILRKIGLDRADARIPGMREHNFKDFMSFPRLGRKELSYPRFQPVPHPELSGVRRIIQAVGKRDRLLHFPWHDFGIFLDFLREAAIDPDVTHIRLTVYRVSQESSVLNALVNAARNGKKVTVLVEVLARFDEENNISWINDLRDEGVEVIPGVRGLKVHAKICLVSRREGKRSRHYAAIGTGNFNEDTARIYTDHMLLTANPAIAGEISDVFEFFRNNYKVPDFRELVVSPFGSRDQFVEWIREERARHRRGEPAWIRLRLNNLADEVLMRELLDAADEGVSVKILVRGMNCLVPPAPEEHPLLETRGLVGRFLEHSRMVGFANGGKPKVFLTSGDWMTRNLDGRIEVSCPVHDKILSRRLLEEFEMQWSDTENARRWSQDNANLRIAGPSRDCHRDIPRWLEEKCQ